MPDNSFYHPFQKPSKEEWQQKLGDSAQKVFNLSPSVKAPVFVHQQDKLDLPTLAKETDNNWNIASLVHADSSQRMNIDGLLALKNGADELVFHLRKLPQIDALLKEIELPMIVTSFCVPSMGAKKVTQLVQSLAQHTQSKNWSKLQGSIQYNPFSAANRLRPNTTEYWTTVHDLFPSFKSLTLTQDRSLDIELAYAKIINQAQKLLNTKDENLIISKIQIKLIAQKNTISTIASVRAFKFLWLNFLKDNQLTLHLPDIFMVLDNMEWTDDINQNRILATSQALASVIAGCDHLMIPYEKKDVFSARIARNIQHILKMESHLDQVVDPAAGSKQMDALTQALILATAKELKK